LLIFAVVVFQLFFIVAARIRPRRLGAIRRRLAALEVQVVDWLSSNNTQHAPC
jgi:hypothetical protein